MLLFFFKVTSNFFLLIPIISNKDSIKITGDNTTSYIRFQVEDIFLSSNLSIINLFNRYCIKNNPINNNRFPCIILILKKLYKRGTNKYMIFLIPNSQ